MPGFCHAALTLLVKQSGLAGVPAKVRPLVAGIGTNAPGTASSRDRRSHQSGLRYGCDRRTSDWLARHADSGNLSPMGKKGEAMARECRRVVTGHTPEGKSAVLYDSSVPLLEEDSAGARQEDRAGAASRVIWTTQGFPADNDGSSDAASRKVGTSESDGTIFRIVQYAPGVTARHHRTNSIDYAVVLSGSIEMELDSETVQLAAGDLLVQRGTIHNWINNGTDPCIIAFVLIGAHPATVNAVPLPAVG